MKFEKGMLASLTDGKEYLVIETTILDNIIYAYLVENEKMDNIKFCVVEYPDDKIKLSEVEDIELRQILLREFASHF